MKIFARTQRNFDLTDYVGKDVWILMRSDLGGLFYLKLIHQYSKEHFQVCRVSKLYVFKQGSRGLWDIDHSFNAKLGVKNDIDRDYDYVVEYPLDIMTTDEMIEMLNPAGDTE